MDLVLQRLNLDSSIVYRRHATSVDDFAHALNEHEYEIVQFSGHGSQEGIYLEDSHHNASTLISARQITKILRETSPNIKAAIFVSCFSASSIPDLIHASPHLITVSGPADDDSSIEFIGAFYEEYLRSGSIGKAFGRAQVYTSFVKQEIEFSAVLSRRAMEEQADRILFQVYPSDLDSLLIDITEAEADIENLDITRDKFLALLSRKIRVHKWTFSSPRELTILSVGPYFGLFSWRDANDVVFCHKIMQVKEEVDEKTCEAWASLIVAYNDHYVDPYRTTKDPRAPSMRDWLKSAIDGFYRTFDVFFEKGWQTEIIRQVAPDQFEVTRSLISANLRMCDAKFHREDFAATVMYLESILSSIHDLLDSMTPRLTR